MVQRRLARSWDDVPEAVREDVRRESSGDLRRIELTDRPEGGYSVVVHPEPLEPDWESSAEAIADDVAFTEVLGRVRPVKLFPDTAADRGAADPGIDPPAGDGDPS
jgi:hypothetical protein